MDLWAMYDATPDLPGCAICGVTGKCLVRAAWARGYPERRGTVHWRPWSGRREHVDGGGSFYACVFQT